MIDDSEHGRCVSAWIERVASGQSAARLIDAFEAAFSMLWSRAHVTLGEVTLAAIVDRVLWSAQEQFPFLSALELNTTRLRCDALRAHAAQVPPEQLANGIAFVLVELLTVVGNLTADILTPALHAELSRTPSGGETSPGDPSRERGRS